MLLCSAWFLVWPENERIKTRVYLVKEIYLSCCLKQYCDGNLYKLKIKIITQILKHIIFLSSHQGGMMTRALGMKIVIVAMVKLLDSYYAR